VDFALAAFFVAPGLALGSFLNVVAARVPLRRSIVTPRSACPSCATPIEWYDNIPLLSYAVLRGRCRSCSTRIGLVYPAVELLTAALIAGSVLRFGLTARAAIAAGVCAVLVVVSATDLEHRIVPNRIVLPATVAVLVANLVVSPGIEWPLAAIAAATFLFLPALAAPGALGMGDVKLALFLGAALGRTTGVGIMLGLLAALVPSLILLAKHGRKARKMALPLAPFLALGGLIALFAGQPLLELYLRH
jgi:prepilin signal peptidase PulO-like enzyme (type II secretory pathway)